MRTTRFYPRKKKEGIPSPIKLLEHRPANPDPLYLENKSGTMINRKKRGERITKEKKVYTYTYIYITYVYIRENKRGNDKI